MSFIFYIAKILILEIVIYFIRVMNTYFYIVFIYLLA